MVFHKPSKKRDMWYPHSVDGWYLGRAPDHYHCHRVYFTKTRAERIAQTVKLSPHKWRVPQTSAKHVALDASLHLIQALHNPDPEATFLASKKDTSNVLEKIASIFASRCPQPEENHPPVPQHVIEQVQHPRVVSQYPPISQFPGKHAQCERV